MQDINYVLTLDAETQTLIEPIIDPSFCKFYFTDSITNFANGESGVTSSIPTGEEVDTLPQYSVFWNKNLYPVDPDKQTQTVTVSGYAGSPYNENSQTVSDDESFNVNYLNPCVMPEHVYIEGPTLLADEDYIIESPAKPLTQHGEFTIVTVPNSHNLCGTITIEPKYDNLPLTGDPVTYDPINMRFIAESDNQALIA